jgi:hypothetical protein
MENASYELKMPTMASQLLKDVSCGVSSYVHIFFRFMKTLIVTYILVSGGDSIIYLVIGHCVCNLFSHLLGDAICCTFFQCIQPMLHEKDNNMMQKTCQMLFITKEE